MSVQFPVFVFLFLLTRVLLAETDSHYLETLLGQRVFSSFVFLSLQNLSTQFAGDEVSARFMQCGCCLSEHLDTCWNVWVSPWMSLLKVFASFKVR